MTTQLAKLSKPTPPTRDYVVVIGPFSLEEAANMAKLDPGEVAAMVEEHGKCSTTYGRIREIEIRRK